jgi:hypothetical protein
MRGCFLPSEFLCHTSGPICKWETNAPLPSSTKIPTTHSQSGRFFLPSIGHYNRPGFLTPGTLLSCSAKALPAAGLPHSKAPRGAQFQPAIGYAPLSRVSLHSSCVSSGIRSGEGNSASEMASVRPQLYSAVGRNSPTLPSGSAACGNQTRTGQSLPEPLPRTALAAIAKPGGEVDPSLKSFRTRVAFP